MKLNLYQIDAFSDRPFGGNPAAVIPLKEWLDDKLMQAIAEENNLSETAFFVAEDNVYRIRWFTPVCEVPLCGHATLASAHVLFNILGVKGDIIEFESLSGPLSVTRDNDFLTLNFPLYIPEKCEMPENLFKGLGVRPVECLKSEDYIAVFENEADLAAIEPDHAYLKRLDLRGVIVTSVSDSCDFVARFFAPKYAIPEDPVTGSAYTQLVPYWMEKLGKNKMTARQVSSRGGELVCEVIDNRVKITGKAYTYLEGTIKI